MVVVVDCVVVVDDGAELDAADAPEGAAPGAPVVSEGAMAPGAPDAVGAPELSVVVVVVVVSELVAVLAVLLPPHAARDDAAASPAPQIRALRIQFI